MEAKNLVNSYNNKDTENVLLAMLQELTKSKALNLVDNISTIDQFDDLLKSKGNIELFFSNIKNTIIPNIKIGKSKIDSNEYFINMENNSIMENSYYEIVEVIEKDGRIIFQACDSDIDGLYAYYDFETGSIISKKDDRRIYGFC